MIFFFFKQKTAYELKECDWSSDVCSSDLFQNPYHSDDCRDQKEYQQDYPQEYFSPKVHIILFARATLPLRKAGNQEN